MSGLLFLESSDFSVQQGSKGPILCNIIRGISLVLFYSPKCEHCKNLIPIFKRLPGSMSGIQFGLLNVSIDTNVVKMSKNTVTEIKYVPLILLFVNGSPFIRFDGQATEMNIKNFIVDVVSKIHQKNTTYFYKDNINI